MNAGEPLPDTRPVTLAAAFLHQRELAKVKWIMSQNGTEVPDEITPINLRHWREEFYRFHGCVYRRWLREEMESELLKFLNRQQAFNAKFNKLQPLRVGASTINDTMRQLRGLIGEIDDLANKLVYNAAGYLVGRDVPEELAA